MENNGILQIGQSTVIINGGNPLPGCPTNWNDAKRWEEDANCLKEHGDEPEWSWDCGYKLDFDGPILSVSSRFYPPKSHYGPTWDGTVNVKIFDKHIIEKKFDCKTLDELKVKVEQFVNEIKNKIELAMNQINIPE